jgi:hypothetical protein
MTHICKRTSWLSLGCLLLIGLTVGQRASDAFAAEPAFVPATGTDGNTFEAIQDVQTGLMWGKDINKIDHMLNT